MYGIVVFLFCVAFSLGKPTERQGAKEKYIRFNLLQHLPCPHDKNAVWSEKLRFVAEQYNLKEGNVKGCYTFGGDMAVLETLEQDTPIQTYIEVKDSPRPGKAPEKCYRPGSDGCGGVGSCVYCDACSIFSDADIKAKVGGNETVIENELICQQTFEKGTKKRIDVEFCFPTLREFLESKQLDPTVWEDIIDDGQPLKKIGLYMKLRLYDTKINEQFKEVLEYDEQKPTEPKSKDLLPFYQDLDKNMIGCHIIQGNLFLRSKDNDIEFE